LHFNAKVTLSLFSANDFVQRVTEARPEATAITDSFGSYCERAREIFQPVADVHRNKDIPSSLHVSPATGETHPPTSARATAAPPGPHGRRELLDARQPGVTP
jgi:FixJ family two-component response regulator